MTMLGLETFRQMLWPKYEKKKVKVTKNIFSIHLLKQTGPKHVLKFKGSNKSNTVQYLFGTVALCFRF